MMTTPAQAIASGTSHTSQSGADLTVVALWAKSCMIARGRTYQCPCPVGEWRTVPESRYAVGVDVAAERA